MSAEQSNIAVNALRLACHCKANSYSFSAATPLDSTFTDVRICQCTDCRLQTGNLASWFVRAPHKPFNPKYVPDTLKAYQVDTSLTHYFCRTCSSQLFRREDPPDGDGEPEFWIFIGCLDLPPDYRFKISHVEGIEEGSDGGLASWLPGVRYHGKNGVTLKDDDIRGLESSEDSAGSSGNAAGDGETEDDQLSDNGEDGAGRLRGECHCSNIELRLSRLADNNEYKPPLIYSDNTDLVIPYWTPQDQQPPIDHENPWWIRKAAPNSEHKRFLGGNCTCTSCRTISGTEVQSWIFVPTNCIHIILPNGESIPWPSRETLINGSDRRVNRIIGVYKSSPGDPGVIRGFCKKCGANIFWDGLTRRNFIDLSAGLFTINGTKQQEWIEWWTERVSYVEDTKGIAREDIGLLVETGIREWRKRSSFV
ncbi:hypothetical protein TWF481_003139 [Arthrobotrys musiformis]|uniref:CENP-V/GFA domain-containing protein n=1 Tax=Arthrobotrys musiformis TaxID=47236 RepID=A0AAV9VRY4_9PEZI